MDIIIKLLLIFLLVLQIFVLMYILYTTYVRHQNDKKFWEQQEEISNEVLKQLQEQPAVVLREDNVKSEEDKDINKKRDNKNGDR